MFKNIKDNGALLSLISNVFFAVQFPLIRLSLNYIKPSQAAVLEAAFTIFFCLMLMKIQKKKADLVISWGGVASGLLNTAGLILLFEGLARIHPGIVGLVGRLYFVYAMLISYIYFQERPTKSELVFVLVAILGVFLVSFQNSLSSPGNAIGILMAILYPAAFALQNAVIKTTIRQSEPLVILLNTKIVAVVPLIFYSAIRLNSGFLDFSLTGSSIILCSTFISTFLGLLIFYRAMAITTFYITNLMKAAEPVLVLLFSSFLFPITLSPPSVLGIILILVSVLALAKTKRETK